MRLTYKKLVTLVNEAFERLEIKNYEAYEAIRTRFRGQDYEGGAATIYIRCRTKGTPPYYADFTLLAFMWLSEMEQKLNSGYSLTLELKRNAGLADAELKFVKLKP